MIVVTGGAGMIGSNLVAALNAAGHDDILVVDDLTDGTKCRNLADLSIADYQDKDEFLANVERGALGRIDVVFHQGACSTTTEWNGKFMMEVNYTYSKKLLGFCFERRVPFLYASSAAVYGGSAEFREEPALERPLNVYGWSKKLFDDYVRAKVLPVAQSPVVGLRYFNVYGPRETHKGRMASVAFHFFNQYQAEGKVRLFEGCDGYGNGEQRRDFVFIDDVVRANLHFLDSGASGIFNLGTGSAQSFNDVAVATVNACRAAQGEVALSLAELHGRGMIEYIAFPEALKGKYQSYTEADISLLRKSGYDAPFATVEEGVGEYVKDRLKA